MTVSQAYVSGFCKAAEAMGVDPVALCKRAAPVSLLGAVGRGFRRYGSLLRGGRVAELQARADKFDSMASRYAAKGFAADAARRVPADAMRAAARTAGGPPAGAWQSFERDARAGLDDLLNRIVDATSFTKARRIPAAGAGRAQRQAGRARSMPAAGRNAVANAGPSPHNVAQRAQHQADRARSMLAAERNAVDNAQVATMYGALGLGGLGYHYLSSGDPDGGQDAT